MAGGIVICIFLNIRVYRSEHRFTWVHDIRSLPTTTGTTLFSNAPEGLQVGLRREALSVEPFATLRRCPNARCQWWFQRIEAKHALQRSAVVVFVANFYQQREAVMTLDAYRDEAVASSCNQITLPYRRCK